MDAQIETPPSAPHTVISLKKRADFLRIQASPHRFSRPSFLLACLALGEGHPLAAHAAIGYTATKKLGNAVARNRIKRRLRAAAVPLLQQHGRPGFGYVLIARHAALSVDFATLADEMKWALRKVHEACDNPAATSPTPPPRRKSRR